MNAQQKIFVGVFAVFIWIVALFVHHQWADIDVVSITTLCQATLVGLGVTHLSTGDPEEVAVDVAPQSQKDSPT